MAIFTEPEIIAPEKANFESLEVDLVFQPAGLNATDGTLIIQRGDEILYADHINISSVNERAAYIKGLEKVIGKRQAYIVRQALEQLAYQFAPAMAASSTVGFDAEEDELIGAADEYAPAKQNSATDEECTYCNEDYIEQTPAIYNSSEVVFEQPQINDEQPAAAVLAVVEPIVLPVKGLNIPFIDVPLVEGDLVEVKRLNPSVFTVIGLAKNPGAFPYLPDMHYNLMQALGFAGGVDMIADPRFVSIYRQGGNGEVVSATFRIDKKFMADSYNVKIKPGDVISIDVTPRTRTNLLLHQILRLNFGVYIRPGLFND